MRRTHLSLYYLAGYLVVAGVALIATGQLAMRLLLSNGEYGDALPRLLGVVLLALGILIAQIIRHRIEVLYSTTLVVRGLILTVLAGLFVATRDPFFLVLLGIVGLGVLLTGASYLLDRRGSAAVRGAAKAP
jgi:uncharacterized membrane protein YoaK (UPF0700 family)